LARKLGATGLESDVWITRDGVPVLDHDGVVRAGIRKRSIRDFDRESLPPHVPSLAELYATVGVDYALSLDVKDPEAVPATLAVAEQFGATANLWLCHHDWQVVAPWRERSETVKLVDSTRLRRITEGAERRVATLAEVGIDALNMHWTDWNAGLVTLTHRFERYAFGWDAQQPRALALGFAYGLDGVYSDHVDRMMTALEDQLR
jgi:glycerophosphoryl diester phosphodiesterase